MVSLKKKICNYIASEWISEYESNRQFAKDHAIDEKVVRRILKPEGSGISLTTLERICEAREIKISEFFKMIGE
ncbi:helix-turn-helix transcriptional regulator [Seonamhaeicola sp.]|uniref:helix-turn-helix domain-containing protein n=1 Tax=Seonamhaeicola sp. TaxID=1912245 RepID=UPI00262B4810|nr:helix-turn-helix transcriptional regulator [Seonamhaeicola sp.]